MRRRKAKTLLFGAPEYVHDFMSLTLGFENVYINGAVMASEDSEPPTGSFDDDFDLIISTYTYSPQAELTEKRSCAAVANVGCSDDGYSVYILKTGGNVRSDLPVIATADGRIIRFGI
jgi:hypothetical protein